MAKRQTKNKRKRSVLAPSPPQMVILRVCMVLLALLLAAITLLNRGSDTVMNTAYPRKYDEYVTYYAGKYQIDPYCIPLSAPKAILTRRLNPTLAHAG